jgi:hypothetical protein
MAQRDNNPLVPALAAGGALLLFISLLINWYSVEGSAQGLSESIGVARPDTATLLLALIAGAAGLVAVRRFRGPTHGKSGSGLLAGLGLAAFLYVLANLIKKPQLLDLLSTAFDKVQEQAGAQLPEGTDFGVGLGPGLWIALLGSLLLLGAGASELGNRAGGAQTAGAVPAPGGFSAPPSGPPAAGGGAQATTAGTPAPPADPSAGWKPDPYGQAAQRYWDGTAWTQHTS